MQKTEIPLKPILIVICLLASVSLFAKGTKILEKETKIQGTTFTKGSSITTNKDGYVTKAILGNDQKVMNENFSSSMNYIFPKGSVLIYDDPINPLGEPNEMPDKVKEIKITQDVKIGKIPFEKGSTLRISGSYFERDGKRTYNANISSQIKEPLKVGKAVIPAKAHVQIQSNGKIRYMKDGSWDWHNVD